MNKKEILKSNSEFEYIRKQHLNSMIKTFGLDKIRLVIGRVTPVSKTEIEEIENKFKKELLERVFKKTKEEQTMFKKIKDFFVGEKYEGFVRCYKCNYFWHTTKPEINISFKDLPRFSKGIDGLCKKCKIKQEETND